MRVGELIELLQREFNENDEVIANYLRQSVDGKVIGYEERPLLDSVLEKCGNKLVIKPLIY